MPQLHTFQEAIDNIYAGGGAYRVGVPPTYALGWGEFVEYWPTYSKAASPFSLEDQKSVDWVLIGPDEWKASQERLAKLARECQEENAKKMAKQFKSLVPPKPLPVESGTRERQRLWSMIFKWK